MYQKRIWDKLITSINQFVELVYEQYDLRNEEIRIVEGEGKEDVILPNFCNQK